MKFKFILILAINLLPIINQGSISQMVNPGYVYANKYFFSDEKSSLSVIIYARRDTTIEIWVDGVKDTSNIVRGHYSINGFECWDTGIAYTLNSAKNGPLIVYSRENLGDGLEFQYDAPEKGMSFGNVSFYDCLNINRKAHWEMNYWKNLPPQKLLNLNNTAYYLQKIGCNDCAIEVLEQLIKIAPKRIVAYLNLADAYWEIEDKDKAIENYNKYVELMKEKGWENKIPKRVYERVKVEH